MYQIDNATSVNALPAPTAPGPNPSSYFTKGNPAGAVQATIVDDEWLNMVQMEICNAITGAGLILSKADRTQLLQAIRAMGANTSSTAQAGLNYTYIAANNFKVIQRTNGGAAKVDTLPGVAPGVMAAGWVTVIKNNDLTGLLAVTTGAGATLDGVAAGTCIYLGPGQSVMIVSDGANYFTRYKPSRARLSQNTTIFVAAGGAANGPGLTAGTAFLTNQQAVNFIYNTLDLNGFQVTVSAGAAGAYNAITTIGGTPMGAGTGNPSIIMEGNGSTITTVSGIDCFSISNSAYVQVNGYTLATVAGGSAACISTINGGRCVVGTNMNFGQGGANGQLYANGGGYIYLPNSYTISGGSQMHWYARMGGMIESPGGITITLTGTPAFSGAFAIASQLGGMTPTVSVTFTGAATGARYVVQLNGMISTGGGGASYFPGNSAGTSLSGGQYG